MDNFLFQSNKSKKKENKENSRQDFKKNLSIISNDYSTKKFGSVIYQNKNLYFDMNKLFSQNNKINLNPSELSKKGSSINKSSLITNSLSNSNILLKSTEENLIQSINNNDALFPANSLKNINTKKDSKKNIKKFNKAILKNVIKFYQKLFSQENEVLEKNKDSKPRNRSSTKIINIKLIEEIEKERNKIIEEQKKNSIMLSASNIHNIIKHSNRQSFFQFGAKKKKKTKYLSSIGTFKRKKINITPKNNFQIKSLNKVNSDISKQIIGSSVRDIKKEIKQLETLDITDLIKKSKNKNKKKTNIKRQSLYDSSLNFDISKIKQDKKEEVYQKRFRNLFSCNNLFDSLDDDENEDLEKMPIFFIGPKDKLCYIIDLMTLIASFISLIYIPYFLAFSLNECKLEFFSGAFILFLFNDLIYFIDMITGFFRAFYNFEEVLIVKKRYMFLNYLKGWFIFDLIEAIPYLLLLNSKKEFCNKGNYNNFAYGNNLNYSFLLFKIFKIFKTFKNSAIRAVNKFLNKSNFFYDWKAIFAYIILILCVLHIASCYFIFLGNNVHPGWYAEGLQSESNKDIYITSIYYVVTTLTTVGYGDIAVESKYQRIFQIVLLIVGTFSYSWLLTYISNYIKKNNEKYIIYEEKVKILEEIKINYPNLSNNLYERITRYLKYNKSKYKYNIKYVLDSLPSSIQNNLIIEIYKPIIKNFLFFKYFENSDFFVKIVTSMKPILSMKDDILINEGDVIEDIIFIKKGRLSLEVDINLDGTKNKFEQNLINTNSISNRIDSLSYFKSLNHSKNEDKNFNFSTLNLTFKKTNENKFESKKCQKKQLKILDLRSNEHFGDVLMILNEKSPVTIKVKSKKAELLFLPKTDATEISNLYPNIWKRIVTKSLYNLNKIKDIINKKVKLYCDLNDIPLNEEFKKNFSGFNKDVKSKNCTQINQRKNISDKYIESIIKEEDESSYQSPNNSNKHKKKLSRSKNSIEINKKGNDYSIEERTSSNIKSNIINCKSEILNQINNKNIEIKLNNLNLNKKVEDENFERVNEEIFSNEKLCTNIINKRILMNNYDKNNYIFHQIKNDKNEELISHSNSFDKINKLLKDNDIPDIDIEKVLIDNNSNYGDQNNKKINIYNNIVINSSHKKNNIINNSNYFQKNKFDYLVNSTADSFSINSTYENINKISKFKYASSKFLQEKVKNLLFQPLIRSSYKTVHSARNLLNEVKENQNLKNKNSKNKSNFYHYTEKKELENNKSPTSIPFTKNKIIHLLHDNDGDLSNNKKERHRRSTSNDIEDINFYTQIKMKARNSCKNFDKFRKTNNYEDKISKNIEKNKQNLNNPKEYFSVLFNKILDRKKK